jgi:hypothetical protein
VTNVPAQALTLLNDKFALQQAEFWADRIATAEANSASNRIATMLRDALGREPAKTEAAAFEQLAESLAKLHEVPPDAVLASRVVWRDVAHVMLNLKEFIYIP